MRIKEIRRYRRALREFERLVDSQLRNCSCRVTLAQCLVLLAIDEKGQSNMGQLASHLRLDHSTLSRTVDGLVQKKLLERVRGERDRRVVWIRLTADGVARCREIHRRNDAYCQGVFEKMAPSGRDTVVRSFEILVQAYLDHEAEGKRA